MKKIFVIIISLLIANSAFAAAPLKTSLDKLLKSFKGGELIKIPSFTATPWPNGAVSILDGSYKNSPVNIDALIAYPKKGEAPYPLVVFSHASGGPDNLVVNGLNLTNKWQSNYGKKALQ
tara:strand:- start:111 stop:470 length:360 start_codon:yes stop_codon:yes gene_type:complete